MEETSGCGVVDVGVDVGRVGGATVTSSGHTIPFAGITRNCRNIKMFLK